MTFLCNKTKQLDPIQILLIALALSMDSLAVSVANGLSMTRLNVKKAFFIAGTFAGIQALMPVLGYYAGMLVRDWVEDWDHWIAFILLLMIGGKMIYEAFLNDERSDVKFAIVTVIIQGIATSIDAMVIGLGFALLDYEIVLPVIMIGFTTFGFSLLGLWFGRILGRRFERKITILGGAILIAIGSKILIEHLYF